MSELKLAIIILLLSLFYDILILQQLVPYLIVSQDYIYTIFSALVTVGVLGSTILSTVLSVNDISCLGFSFKEILCFNECPVKIEQMLLISISPITLATLALAFNLATTMTFLLLFTVCVIIFYSNKTWQLISNKNLLVNIIERYIEQTLKDNDLESFNSKIAIWGKELDDAIRNDDDLLQKQYLELLYSIYSTKQEVGKGNLNEKINYILSQTFLIAIKKFGISMTYEKLNLQKFNEIEIIRTYTNKIQYATFEEINDLNIIGSIDNIKYNLNASEDIIVFILHQYFLSIFNNDFISTNKKYTTLNKYFEANCEFSDYANNSNAQIKAMQYCYLDGVLNNRHEDERIKIFEIIINNLYRKNSHFCRNYIIYIASIFRSSYFYIFYEREFLKESFRNSLKETLMKQVDTIDNLDISLHNLIKKESFEVLKYYIEDAFDSDFKAFNVFDYFPEGFTVKSAIWTRESRIDFAVIFYLATMEYNLPIFDLLENNKYELKVKINICRRILNLYNFPTGKIDESILKQVKVMEEFLNNEILIVDDLVREDFEKINTYLQQLTDQLKEQVVIQDIPVDRLEDEIKNNLRYQDVIFDDSIPLNHSYQLSPWFEIDASSNNMRIILVDSIIKIIDQLIVNTLPCITLSFNQSGVNCLLEQIKGQEITIRNYTFIDDLSFSQAVRESFEYQQLEKLLREIRNPDTYIIKRPVFLKQPLKINMQINSIYTEQPNKEQIDKYLERYKISDLHYKLSNSVVYKYHSASEWVQKNVKIRSVNFSFELSISEESGFRIDLSRTHNI